MVHEPCIHIQKAREPASPPSREGRWEYVVKVCAGDCGYEPSSKALGIGTGVE